MFQPVKLKDLVLEYKEIVNPRKSTGLGEADIAELAGDIKDRGMLQSPVVQVFHDGDQVVTVVLDGQRRILATNYLYDRGEWADDDVIVQFLYGEEAIPYTPKSAIKAMLDAAAIGSRRKGLSSYEQTEHAAHLRKAGATNEEIGKAIDRSPTWVSRMLTAYAKATPALLAAWKAGDLPDEQVKDLAKVPEDVQAHKVAATIETRSSGDRASLSQARASVKDEASRAAPTKSPAARAIAAPGAADGTATSPDTADKPPYNRRSPAEYAELVGLRRDFPPKDPYVKGFLDAAAFLGGYDLKTGKALETYLRDASQRKQRASAAKPKPQKPTPRPPRKAKTPKKK